MTDIPEPTEADYQQSLVGLYPCLALCDEPRDLEWAVNVAAMAFRRARHAERRLALLEKAISGEVENL